jgi:hypothetical protein
VRGWQAAGRREAAARLFNIYAKLDVDDRAAAVAEGYSRGLLHVPGRS